MRLHHHIPRPLLQLIATILLSPKVSRASPNPHVSVQAGFSFDELFARYDCSGGSLCGYYNQLCCLTGSACYTGADQIASCTAEAAATGGYWSSYTTTYVRTDLITTTSVVSTYINTGAAPTATISCAPDNPPCGTICCASDQYCFSQSQGQCAPAAYGSSVVPTTAYNTITTAPQTRSTAEPGAPILGTSRGTTVVTETTATTTFIPPVATGANITTTGQEVTSSSHLSGGAIAGIVIGVLAGLFLLLLLLFCCGVGALLEGCFAIFGLGRKRRVTEVEEYEHRSHHASGGAAAGRRTWWGGAARPPARVDREKSHETRNLLGIAAVLAAFFACLGLKRRREKKKEQERFSEYTYSDYTSESSMSSEDRRTEDRRTHATRYSRRG